jgi:hypothetical protein
VVDASEYPELKRACFERWDRETSQVNVVFAQGKTGTSAIAAGLKRAAFNPVFQIHTLRPRALARIEAKYTRRPNDSYPRHVWEAQWLGAHRPSEEHPWVLVTSVRDPIARVVSRVFQQKSRFGGLDATPDALMAELSEAFRRDEERLDSEGWDWFDQDLRTVLGQSVYDAPFDPAVGYGTITATHVRALLLRGESLEKAPKALQQHFGRTVTLAHENAGTDKDYAALYRAVLDRFRPPAAFVDRVYETTQARHFYSAAEREAFRRHWTRPVDGTDS